MNLACLRRTSLCPWAIGVVLAVLLNSTLVQLDVLRMAMNEVSYCRPADRLKASGDAVFVYQNSILGDADSRFHTDENYVGLARAEFDGHTAATHSESRVRVVCLFIIDCLSYVLEDLANQMHRI